MSKKQSTFKRSVASIPDLELRDRLERARAALAAVRRAPESRAASKLETDICREIRMLEGDLGQRL